MIQRAVAALLALFFLAAGVLHFVELEGFTRIVPPFLPAPEAIVIATGVYEIVLAIAMLASLNHPRLQLLGYGAVAYCIAVLPANIYQAVEGFSNMGLPADANVLWGRVVLQLPLILLILWACKVNKPE